MQKRKIGIILGAALGAACLVGATFAAWAVTDNADPLGIKITPQNNATGGFNTMVLEWGDKAHFTDMSDFELGVSKYANIEVKSTITGDTNDISGGNLVVTLEDRTQAVKPTGDAKLIDFISVVVSTKDPETETLGVDDKLITLPLKEAEKETPTLTKSIDISTDRSGAKKTIYFEITVNQTSVNGETLSFDSFSQIKNDVLYLSVDWNEPSATVGNHVTQTPVYIKSETVPSIYAFNSVNFNENGKFPGVPMTKMNVAMVDGKDYYFTYNVPTDPNGTNFDTIIFSWNDGTAQTVNIPISGAATDSLFVVTNKEPANAMTGEWRKLPDLVELDYHVVGIGENWDRNNSNMMTPDADKVCYSKTITTTTENNRFKVQASDGMQYWGEFKGGVSDNTEVVTLGEIGTYQIDFYPAGMTKYRKNGQIVTEGTEGAEAVTVYIDVHKQ